MGKKGMAAPIVWPEPAAIMVESFFCEGKAGQLGKQDLRSRQHTKAMGNKQVEIPAEAKARRQLGRHVAAPQTPGQTGRQRLQDDEHQLSGR
jgi:hypothetical protein